MNKQVEMSSRVSRREKLHLERDRMTTWMRENDAAAATTTRAIGVESHANTTMRRASLAPCTQSVPSIDRFSH